jgi:hypothetical protein
MCVAVLSQMPEASTSGWACHAATIYGPLKCRSTYIAQLLGVVEPKIAIFLSSPPKNLQTICWTSIMFIYEHYGCSIVLRTHTWSGLLTRFVQVPHRQVPSFGAGGFLPTSFLPCGWRSYGYRLQFSHCISPLDVCPSERMCSDCTICYIRCNFTLAFTLGLPQRWYRPR